MKSVWSLESLASCSTSRSRSGRYRDIGFRYNYRIFVMFLVYVLHGLHHHYHLVVLFKKCKKHKGTFTSGDKKAKMSHHCFEKIHNYFLAIAEC